jgi:DNA-binding transcriptional LysR family regulator
MLDMKRLRVLREVSSQRSFSAAADALYMSQSAVSQQIATLEREVGMRLVERAGAGPTLTEAGNVLVSHADAAMARLAEAERELAAIAGLEGGEVRVASFPSASATLLTAGLSLFSRRHPNVRLTVAEAEPEDSLPRLRAGEIDLAIVFDYPSAPAQFDRDIELTLLLTESLHLALPKKHRLAGRRAVRLADLAEEPWLCGVRPSSCGEVVIQACRDAGFEPRITFESDDYNVLQGYVSAGLGVTLLPDLALASLRPDLVALPTRPKAPKRRVWAATRPEGSCSPATEAMVSVLEEVASELGDRAARAAA